MSSEIEALEDRLNRRLAGIESMLREVRSLVGPFGTLFPDGSMLVQTIHGTKYFIDPSDLIMAPQLVVYRQWEADLSAFMINSVNSDTVFVDVGANFGYFTCLVGSRVGPSGKGAVYAFEANPAMQQLLAKNVKINWSMSTVNAYGVAITDEAGFVEFAVPADRAANGSIKTNCASSSSESFIVRAVTLDQILPDRPVDLMKIDVEGFEARVLQGSATTIQRSEDINIIIEWSLGQMADAGFSADDLLAIFSRYGLRPYRLPRTRFISESEWEEYSLSEESLRTVGYDNIVLRRKR